MKKITLLITTIVIAFVIPFNKGQSVNAEDVSQQALQLVERGFEAQVSLSGKEQSLSEIRQTLEPYFTDAVIEKFIEENVVKTDQGYSVLGSDFPLHYIPFFSYEHTKVKQINKGILVYEFFKENNEGPVTYNDHYEGLLLQREEGGWKVADIYMDLSEQAIEKWTAENVVKSTSDNDKRKAPNNPKIGIPLKNLVFQHTSDYQVKESENEQPLVTLFTSTISIFQ